LNRDEFDAFKTEQNDLFDRLAALERDLEQIQTHLKSVRNSMSMFFFLI